MPGDGDVSPVPALELPGPGQGVLPAAQLCSIAEWSPKPWENSEVGEGPNSNKSWEGLVVSSSLTLRAETQTWGWSQEICNSRALLFPPWTEPKSIAFKLDSDKTLGGSALPAASCQRQPGAAHTRLARCLSSARSAQLQEGQKNHSSISLT